MLESISIKPETISTYVGGPKVIRNHAGSDCVTLNLVTALGTYSVSWGKIELFLLLKELLIPSVFIVSSKF